MPKELLKVMKAVLLVDKNGAAYRSAQAEDLTARVQNPGLNISNPILKIPTGGIQYHENVTALGEKVEDLAALTIAEIDDSFRQSLNKPGLPKFIYVVAITQHVDTGTTYRSGGEEKRLGPRQVSTEQTEATAEAIADEAEKRLKRSSLRGHTGNHQRCRTRHGC